MTLLSTKESHLGLELLRQEIVRRCKMGDYLSYI
jgi:hypothetical protein